MPQNFYELVWIFIIYAFIGWCTEVSYAALDRGIFVNDRMNHIHNECTCKSPVDGKFQTYISVKIKRLIAIVPPFIVKHFFQNKSGNVFQNGSQ